LGSLISNLFLLFEGNVKMIIAGYILIFAYVFFLILGVGNIVQKVSNVEMSRKIIHTGLFVLFIIIDIFLKNTIHQVIIPFLFIIINYLSYKFKIFKNMEREENNEPGTVYFSIAITIIMLLSYIFPKMFYSSGIAIFCLTFGDGFAAIIGKNTKSKLIRGNKSLNGFISCFAFSTIAIILLTHFYNLNLTIFMCIVIGLAVAIFELVGKGLDNFSVVAISFILGFLFMNYNLNNLGESVLVAEILFIIVFFAKGLDYYGSLLAMIMAVSYMYFGGIFGICMLLSEYFFIFGVSKFKKIVLKSNKKEKPRNFLQVLINGGIGTAFIILYGIFNKQSMLIISLISLSGCLIDSVSSDVGVLSKKDTSYDFIKRKRVPKGISGGISILGTISALICAIIIAIIVCIYLKLSIFYIFLIAGLIFLQTIIDSILGSLLQAKFKCTKCQEITEKTVHCDNKTEIIEGIHWVNNNMVNIMSSAITTLIAVAIFLV